MRCSERGRGRARNIKKKYMKVGGLRARGKKRDPQGDSDRGLTEHGSMERDMRRNAESRMIWRPEDSLVRALDPWIRLAKC
jgi:hypothetical protein